MKKDTGIRLVVGWPKGAGGSVTQSVMFDKSRWTVAKAKDWLKRHGYRYGDVDESPSYWRFRQADPDEFSRMRTVRLIRSMAVRGRAANPALRSLLSPNYEVTVTYKHGEPPLRLGGLSDKAVRIVRRLYEGDPRVESVSVKRSSWR